MARRFNFTERKPIPRDHVEVRVYEGDEPRFQVEMNFEGLDDVSFPGDSRIFIEAARKTEVQRFSWGTVAQPRPPVNPRLTHFSDPHVVKFRLKVVEAEGARILGVARKIRPATEESDALRESILAVESVSDMDEVWRLIIDETEPILQVNTELADKEELVHSLSFKTLVLPAVFRQILSRIVDNIERRGVRDYDSDEWQAEWIRFAEKFEPFDHDEHPEQWVDDCTSAFCHTNRIVESFELGK